MFPICDRAGRVIAFGGRAMEADAQAQYLNSPETPLFHKGGSVYNLHNARKAAYDAGTVIAVEGYMDVIGMAQGGIENAVAPLGTALTEDQIGLMWRLAPEPILCFDGDAAGQRAARRAAERALPELKPGHSLRFAVLPEGQDPDDLVKSGGKAAMEAVLGAARPLSEVLWDMTVEGRDVATPERRAALDRDIRELVGRIKDEAVRGHYQQDLKERAYQLFRPQRQVQQPYVRKAQRPWRGKGEPEREPIQTPPPASPREARSNEQQLAAALATHPVYALKHLEALSRVRIAEVPVREFLDGMLGILSDVTEDADDATLVTLLTARMPAPIWAEARDRAERLRLDQLEGFDLDGRIADLLSTLKDRALAEEIVAVQAAMEHEFSETLWHRLRALRQERERLRGLDGER